MHLPSPLPLQLERWVKGVESEGSEICQEARTSCKDGKGGEGSDCERVSEGERSDFTCSAGIRDRHVPLEAIVI